MEISRRSLLVSAAAVAGTMFLPPAAFVAPLTVGVDMAAKSDLMAFAVGTPGEYDWISVFARTPEEAWREWAEYQGLDDESAAFDPDYVTRVEKWDGLRGVNAADWIRAGLGHHCDRCSGETSLDHGCRVICEGVVCEECLTLEDLLIVDLDEAVERLADDIADDGAEAVQARLEQTGVWTSVPPDIWDRAVALAGDA